MRRLPYLCAQLIDFGLTKRLSSNEERSYTLCGTPEYVAPEMVQLQGHGPAVDWWGLGVLTYELLHGYTPFSERGTLAEPMELYRNITHPDVKVDYSTCPSPLSPALVSFLKRLLRRKPAGRLGTRGADEIKSHAALGEMPWSDLEARDLKVWAGVPPLPRRGASVIPLRRFGVMVDPSALAAAALLSTSTDEEDDDEYDDDDTDWDEALPQHAGGDEAQMDLLDDHAAARLDHPRHPAAAAAAVACHGGVAGGAEVHAAAVVAPLSKGAAAAAAAAVASSDLLASSSEVPLVVSLAHATQAHATRGASDEDGALGATGDAGPGSAFPPALATMVSSSMSEGDDDPNDEADLALEALASGVAGPDHRRTASRRTGTVVRRAGSRAGSTSASSTDSTRIITRRNSAHQMATDAMTSAIPSAPDGRAHAAAAAAAAAAALGELTLPASVLQPTVRGLVRRQSAAAAPATPVTTPAAAAAHLSTGAGLPLQAGAVPGARMRRPSLESSLRNSARSSEHSSLQGSPSLASPLIPASKGGQLPPTTAGLRSQLAQSGRGATTGLQPSFEITTMKRTNKGGAPEAESHNVWEYVCMY